MSAGHLSKEDTEVWKGVGILLIVLHNYFHWVRPSPGENEFNFERERTAALLNDLATQPLEAVNLLFSYFGHYGVQLFVFLSAYGLARTYLDREIRWVPFMWRRAGRIYPTFVLAILAHLLFVVTLWNENLVWFLKAYALKLSMLSAFVPDMQLSMVGPWWFFSFIFQFYAVFPLLDRLAKRFGTGGLATVAIGGLVLTIVANPYLTPHGLNLYFTVLGHLPVLCLGIYMARVARFSVDVRVVPVATAIFVAGMWFKAFWYLAPLCVTLLLVAAMPGFVGQVRAWPLGCRFVGYCGAISLPLFAIHGMIRQPFTTLADGSHIWYVTLALGGVFLTVSLIAAQGMLWVERWGRNWIPKLGTGES